MAKPKSNWSTISGIDDALFYTALYMSIAFILNLIVCFLAARDTYQRVKSNDNNVNPNNKWLCQQKSINVENVTRVMDEACSPTKSLDIKTNDYGSDQSSNQPSPLFLPTSVSTYPKPPVLKLASNTASSVTLSPLRIEIPNNSRTQLQILPNSINKMPRLDSFAAIFCFFSVGMGRRWHIYSPIILHVWDTATDIGVIIDWLQVAEIQTFWTHDVTSLYYAVLAILSIAMYRVISGIAIWRTLGWKSGVAQFLDVMVYREVYEAYVDEKIRPTMHFRWIRKMEANFESFWQSLIQTVWILKTEGFVTPLMISSIVLSVYSISSSIIKDDEWKFGGKDSNFRKKCPPHPKFLVRSAFRISEVLARLSIMSLLWLKTTGYYLSGWCIYQGIFYLMLYKQNKLGRDPGNAFAIIIGYPNLSYRDNDYRELNWLIQLFGTLTLWTPFSYICRSNVTIFYAARFSENFIILIGCLVLEMLSWRRDDCAKLFLCVDMFFFGAAIVGILCNTFLIRIYFSKIRRYLHEIEYGLNLDIWGVLKQSVEDIDLLRRFIKRAPTTINKINVDGMTTLMEASKHSDLTVLLCILHGDVYYDKKALLTETVTALQRFAYNKQQRMLHFKKRKGDKWLAPNGYIRDNVGRSCIYYLMKQHAKYRQTIYRNNIWKQNKDFEKRKEWLFVLMKHIAERPPVHCVHKIGYAKTAFELGYIPETAYLSLLSLDRSMSNHGMTRNISDIFRSQSKRNHTRSKTEDFIKQIPASKAKKQHKSNEKHVQLSKQQSVGMIQLTKLQEFADILDEKNTAPEVNASNVAEPETCSERYDLSAIENEKIFVNMADNEGQTPLHWAMQENSMDFLDLLLELGANPNVQCDIRGETAMHTAVRLGRYDIFDALIMWNEKVKNEQIEAVLCDWYVCDNMGASVIFACINYNKCELLCDIFVAGIDVCRLDEEHNTILQYAMKSNKDECVKEIVKKDMLSAALLVNKNIQNKSCLYMAVLAQNIEIVEILIKHLLNKMNADGNNLLYDEIIYCLNQALELQFTNVLKCFFENSKNIILKNKIKCHAMLKNIIVKDDHSNNMLEICCVYFSQCLTLKNNNNENMLFYCVEYDKPKLLKLLMRKFECDINIINNNGLDLIQYCDHFDRPTCKHYIQQQIITNQQSISY